MLRRKKSSDDEGSDKPGEGTPEAGGETAAAASSGSPLLDRLAAAGQEYARELEEVAAESMGELRGEQERLQSNISQALERVRAAETAFREAQEKYLQALAISAGGTAPGSQESVQRAYDAYAAAYAAGVSAAQEADAEIGKYMTAYREAEDALRQKADERFAKAFATYTRSQREAWDAVDPSDVMAATVMAAAESIYSVAAFAAATTRPQSSRTA